MAQHESSHGRGTTQMGVTYHLAEGTRTNMSAMVCKHCGVGKLSTQQRGGPHVRVVSHPSLNFVYCPMLSLIAKQAGSCTWGIISIAAYEKSA